MDNFSKEELHLEPRLDSRIFTRSRISELIPCFTKELKNIKVELSIKVCLPTEIPHEKNLLLILVYKLIYPEGGERRFTSELSIENEGVTSNMLYMMMNSFAERLLNNALRGLL